LAPLISSENNSNQLVKKVEGTAIALVLNCPEISQKFKSRHHDPRPNFESNEEKDSLLIDGSRDNLNTDSCKVISYDSSREPLNESYLD